LKLSDAKQALIVSLPGRPRQVVIDPLGKVLHSLDFDPGQKMSEHTLLEGESVPARVHAARSLGKKGSRSATSALIGAYATEPHWGVRMAIVRALAKAGNQEAAEGLASLASSEADPRVVPELLGNLGSYRDPAVADALCNWLDSDAEGPLARSRALTSLGKQRGGDHLDRLRSEAELYGWWGWGMRGALTGLGQTRTEEARDYLAGRVGYGDGPVQVRMAAAEGLAEAGRWQEIGGRQQTLETLSDLVRDPEYPVRLATSRALRRLGMPGAIVALEATAQSLAPQDRPKIQRSIAGLRRQLKAGGTVPALRKQVEELTEKMRKLAGRVDGLEARPEG
jgi:HEAT repeat protein